MSVPAASELLHVAREGDALRVQLSGEWKLQGERPDGTPVYEALEQGAIKELTFDAAELKDWDSSLLVFLLGCQERCEKAQVKFRRETLPEDVRELLALSEAVPEKQTGRKEAPKANFLARLGSATLTLLEGGREFLQFLGECLLSLWNVARGRGTLSWRELWQTLHETSIAALPIVSLIAVLTGLILAFVGAVQLQKFGASIYVANLVGLGMAREMGALMTAIIMAGRTGAAFAAQLGSMKVNEEIDALKTMGIAPQDYLVTPRMLALFLMMPLLCLYANFVGLVGGAIVGFGMLDLSWAQYLTQTRDAVKLTDIGVGLIKAVTFGGIVAYTGCLRGMQCGNNASAVGLATTSAVVTGITFIVVADAIYDVIFNLLGI